MTKAGTGRRRTPSSHIGGDGREYNAAKKLNAPLPSGLKKKYGQKTTRKTK